MNSTKSYPITVYNTRVTALSTVNYFNPLSNVQRIGYVSSGKEVVPYTPNYYSPFRVINKDGSSNLPRGYGYLVEDNRPYIQDGKPKGRPSYRQEFPYDLYVSYLQRYNITKPADAIIRDEVTGEVINWLPGQPRKGVVDFGHLSKENYLKVFNEQYLTEIWTPKAFRDWYNDSKNYRFETPHTNRSHQYENVTTPLVPQFNSSEAQLLEYKPAYIDGINYENIFKKQQEILIPKK